MFVLQTQVQYFNYDTINRAQSYSASWASIRDLVLFELRLGVSPFKHNALHLDKEFTVVPVLADLVDMVTTLLT